MLLKVYLSASRGGKDIPVFVLVVSGYSVPFIVLLTAASIRRDVSRQLPCSGTL